MYNITVTNKQTDFSVNVSGIQQAVEAAFVINDIPNAVLDVAVVTPEEMQRLNVRYLGHDYPADVLSFLLEETGVSLEGQVIVCPAVANQWSQKYGWGQESELILYAVHGTLHIIGFDDLTPEDELEMRAAEKQVLARFNLSPPWEIIS